MPDSAPPTAQAATPETLRRPTPTVLIVDDELSFATTLSDILAAKGYNAVTAATGVEGMHAAQHVAVDLAIIDLKLPDVSGVEVLARVREISPATEAIILTGQPSLDSALRALNLGAFAYLEKPYDVDRLFLIIERALARRLRRGAGERLSELARLMDRATVPMFAFHPDSGRVSCANAAFARLLGAADPDGTALSLNELFAGSSPDILGSHLATLGQLGRAVTEFALAGGTRLEMTSTLVAREPALAFAVLSDVTARRRGEDESRQARQYFEAIFENLAAGVVIIDSNYEIRQVNPAFARFYRQTPRGLCGRKCHDVIHRRLTPCSMHGEVCPISSCLAAGTTVRVQHRHFDYAGRPHYQECTMAPLHDESGTIVSFVAMFADFTEIQPAQEESEAKSRTLEELNRELTAQREQLGAQASELERTNTELIRLSAAKDDFVSLVSHELRTPLTAISEGINLVADGSLGALNSSQNRFLGVAYRNCIRLGELINDLLDLSKIEAGRMDVRAERFDAAHLLRDISETFAPLAHDKGLALDVETEPGGLAVFADERLARRALTNLVNNAVKFTDAGSIRLAADRSNGTVRISICDSGIGIPEAEQPRIFERFHQVQQRDRNRPAGTGLGLALTRQMIEMNRGRIWFESREGTGTTFMFTLPVDSTASRVAALLRDRARGCATPAAAALVRITNAAELVARHGSAGVEAALTTIDSLMSHAPVRRHSGIGLPDSSEYLFLVDAGGSSCLPALREALAGATFVIHDQVTPVRLAAAVLPLGQEPDSNRLIDHLRTEATDV